MKGLVWLLVIGSVIGVAWGWLRMARRLKERRHAEEARAALFLAQAVRGPAAPAQPAAPEERLLLDSAAKAAEAGEPALAIQLYARLIGRFPHSALVPLARAAVEAQKKKIATPTAPGTTGQG